MGAATRIHTGILKSEARDGSILNKDMPNSTDGPGKDSHSFYKTFNLDLNFFNDENNALEATVKNNDRIASGWAKCPASENRVLIAQLNTDRKLAFELNIHLRYSMGGSMQFVSNNLESTEKQIDRLIGN